MRVTEPVLEELWDRKNDRTEPLDNVIRRAIGMEERPNPCHND